MFLSNKKHRQPVTMGLMIPIVSIDFGYLQFNVFQILNNLLFCVYFCLSAVQQISWAFFGSPTD